MGNRVLAVVIIILSTSIFMSFTKTNESNLELENNLSYFTQSFNMSIVESTGEVGYYNSIAIDSNDVLHISYHDDINGDLKYATNNGGSWTTTTVDHADNVGVTTSIAVDSSGNVHISYWDFTNSNLKYAIYDGFVWSSATVDNSTSGHGSSIAVDFSGNVHISYAGPYTLKYATYDGSSWTTTTVDDEGSVGTFSSLAVDSRGNVHISYSDATNGGLKYANNGFQNTWANYSVDNGDGDYVGMRSSIAVDSNDDVWISYYDDTNTNLKLANLYGINEDGQMGYGSTYVTVDGYVDSASEVGLYSSIAVDSSGNVHIAYGDESNSAVKYATCHGEDCFTVYSNGSTLATISTVAGVYGNNNGGFGKHISLAIDSSENVHISYLDLSNEDLMYSDSITPLPGCTDYAAENFDSTATVDDGSCTWTQVTSDSDSDSVPGFGVLLVVTAVLGSALIMTRRE